MVFGHRAWSEFLAYAQTNNPVEDHYQKYFIHLWEKRKLSATSLGSTYSKLNSVHKQMFGFR